MISLRFFTLFALPFLLALCGCLDPRVNVRRAREVSGPEFEEMYGRDRAFWWHYDYIGKHSGNHWMALYGIVDAGSSPKYLYSVRTPAANLPGDFPGVPQKPLGAGKPDPAEVTRGLKEWRESDRDRERGRS
jgi:hypothetical protein